MISISLLMTWNCPICKKQFARTRQHHKCETAPIHVLFRNTKTLLDLYRKLESRVQEFGKIRISTSKKAITFSHKNGFAILYPRKESIDMGIFMDHASEELIVYKIVPYTKTKTVNWVRLYDNSDLNDSIGLLKQAYLLAK